MLGFSVSQATVSRYLPAPGRRPTQSWRTFLHNQAIAFGHHQYPEEHSDTEYLSLRFCSYWASLMRSVAQIARLSAGLCRWHAHRALTPIARRILLRPGGHTRGAMHHAQRLDTALGCPWKARGNSLPTAVPMRSPPYEARASPKAAVARGSGFSRGSSFEKAQAQNTPKSDVFGAQNADSMRPGRRMPGADRRGIATGWDRPKRCKGSANWSLTSLQQRRARTGGRVIEHEDAGRESGSVARGQAPAGGMLWNRTVIPLKIGGQG